LYTGPEVLDQKSWPRVFDVMKNEMEKDSVQIAEADWYEIMRYYLVTSPDFLGQYKSKKKVGMNRIFQDAEHPLDSLPPAGAFSTLLEYDPSRNILYMGNVTGSLLEFDPMKLTKTFHIDNIPIDIDFNRETGSVYVLGMGTLMPSEEMKGQLTEINPEGKQNVIIDSLKRPVHFTTADFNGDGSPEYLISVFGSTIGKINSGKLSLFSMRDGEFNETIIKQLPGALKTIVGDFNDDDHPDFMALFAQGREVLTMFINKGDLKFEEKQLLEFPPVNGSNCFELADINDDSYPDIIMTNGDNGDYSQIFKPYHGIRIYINNRKYDFKEVYFYPVNGASKVLVKDFDRDGDPDLVALAMYPDLFSWPEETLLFFENQGNLHFDVSYIKNEPSGKWVLLDSGDLDNDGDDDLIVGANHIIQPVLLPDKYREIWNREKKGYAVFKNNSLEGN
jgi:hypothetical protein